jgi:hypothetical protein
VAELLVGACSCDLVRPRLADPIEDERELRARYQRAKLPRTEIIKELERHRRGPARRQEPPNGWTAALAAFALEHARNAGATLYLLDFSARANQLGWPTTVASRCSPSEVRQQPGGWLAEGRPVIVG